MGRHSRMDEPPPGVEPAFLGARQAREECDEKQGDVVAVAEEKSERDLDGEALARAVSGMKEANDAEAARRRAEKERGER